RARRRDAAARRRQGGRGCLLGQVRRGVAADGAGARQARRHPGRHSTDLYRRWRAALNRMSDESRYREQHQLRLSWMPWLWFSMDEKLGAWALPGQHEVQARLRAVEAVELGEGCFVAPEARIFAEPRRPVRIGNRVTIAAEVFLHGPITLGHD